MSLAKKYKDFKVKLPTCDIEAYSRYPDYCHLYDRMWVSLSQNMVCAPLGVQPNKYPIVVKPIINLYGMSKGFDIIKTKQEYDKICSTSAGLFWQPYLKGVQKNLDMVIHKGKILFYHLLDSFPNKNLHGTFICHVPSNEQIPCIAVEWVHEHLSDYTGTVNMEIIGGYITECHLRLNGDNHWYNDSFYKSLQNISNFKFKETMMDYSFAMIPFFEDSYIDDVNYYDYKNTDVTEPCGKFKRYGTAKCKLAYIAEYLKNNNYST
jgi:hypothetical protein